VLLFCAMTATPIFYLLALHDALPLLVGVPGTAEKLFAALHRAGVSVVMISQGSSEHSICCVVRASPADRARAAGEIGRAACRARISLTDVRVARLCTNCTNEY